MNAFYVTKSVVGNTKALHALGLLEQIIELLDLTPKNIHDAFKKSYKDFEDGVKIEVASYSQKIDVIITQDLKDFKQSKVPVLLPADFLSGL